MHKLSVAQKRQLSDLWKADYDGACWPTDKEHIQAEAYIQKIAR